MFGGNQIPLTRPSATLSPLGRGEGINSRGFRFFSLSPPNGERAGVRGRQFHRVRIHKLRIGADEFEFSGVELLNAVVRKILDKRIFSRHHLFKIKADFSDADAPRFGMTGKMHHFGGVKQRFGRHATAQDAQPADFLATFDNDRFQTRAGRRSRRCVAATAAANNGHIKIVSATLLHAASMSQNIGADKNAADASQFASHSKFICRTDLLP